MRTHESNLDIHICVAEPHVKPETINTAGPGKRFLSNWEELSGVERCAHDGIISLFFATFILNTKTENEQKLCTY